MIDLSRTGGTLIDNRYLVTEFKRTFDLELLDCIWIETPALTLSIRLQEIIIFRPKQTLKTLNIIWTPCV